MENKLSITAIILMIVGFTYVGVNMQEPTHYCEEKKITNNCFSLSGGLGTRCYTNPTKTTWKVCSEGWKEIPSPVSFTATRNEVTRLHCNSEGCK